MLDRIESTIAGHPQVREVFQDTGHWCTTGEAGPEWFAMHVECAYENREAVKAFIDQELARRGYALVQYWS